VAAAIAAALACYALYKRGQPEAITFGLTMAAQALNLLFYGLHTSGANLQTAYLFNRLKYAGVLLVPPLWVILTLQYTHRQHLLTRRNVILLFLPAMVMFPIVMTNPLTEWWWTGVRMLTLDGVSAGVTCESTSPIYKLNLVILYSYMVWGLVLCIIHFIQHKERIYRSQTTLMIIAGAIPVVGNIITQAIRHLNLFPWGLDSALFSLSGVLVAIAIFRYRFLDIVPVARQAVIDQVPEGVIVIDTKGRIVDANPAAQAILEASAGSIIGKPLPEATNIQKLRRAFTEATQNDKTLPGRCDVSLSTRDGTRVLSLSITPLTHKASRLVGQIILLHDITEQVAAQREREALYQQTELERERLALTIRTATDAIALLDMQGNVLSSNPPARQILKAQQSDQFPPSVKDFLNQIETIASVSKAEIEIGEQVFHITAAPVAGTGLVLTIHDVTHFKQLASMKDEFVATVSHDLRSPLNSILGNIEIAQEESMPEEERRDALERAKRTVYRMAALINNLLDLAEVEAGIPLKLTSVELDDLALEAAEDLKHLASSKGVSIQYELNQLPPIRADQQLIMRVWHNLIDNAIKYTQEGTITVGVEASENQVLGYVTDTGVGIPANALPFVFDKFFRVDEPQTRDIGGTGLGLALVKSIVEKHRGQIWVESEPDTGSTFTFTLPL
ncbi:MAG: histidine kinase N-terminal 7TM domain-containing protein, partial [Anaerolineae bacterium]